MLEHEQPENGNIEALKNRLILQELREAKLSAGISKQENLIAALRLAEERCAMLTAIMNSSDDAIISKDLNGTVTSWNLAAERIFGFSPGEMIGNPIARLIPDDRLDEEALIQDRLIKGDKVDPFETMRLTSTGRLLQVTLTISPVIDFSGNIIGISKIVRDITSAKQAEQKALILAAIVASTDDAVISKNLDGIITSWNHSAERIFGYTASEMIGESIVKLIPPDRQQEEPKIISKLKRGERVDHFETKRVTKQGLLIDVSLTISPVLDATGRIIGVSKIARDITDQKLEEQRKNDFIAIVSHELKTPLTSMRSYVQLGLVKALENRDSFTETLMRRAENQTHKMSAMIHDFLNVSRLEEGKMSLSLSRFSLSDLIEEVVREFSPLAPAHHIDYLGGSEAYIEGDREKLSHVLINLLSNAVKYSAEGTAVCIRCELADGNVKVNVSDQGIGISAKDQKRLFERFYRVKADQVRNVSGFGIGLYLVAEILKLHNSQIQVQSEPGKGSIFSFSLSYE